MTAVRRILSSLVATAVLVLLVIGSPVALLAWGRPEELRRLPQALSAPDDGGLLLGLFTLVGWAAWLVFTVAVAVEAVNLAAGLPGRRRFRVPGLRPVQGIAAGLLVASLALLAPISRAEGPPPAAPVAAASPVAVPDRAVPDAGHGTGSAPATDHQQAADAGVAAADGVDHVVGPSDSLWSLARQSYGDPTRWRRIAAANPGIDPAALPVGDTIRIPADARPTSPADARGSSPADAPADPRTVTVARGDTLSGLARSHLGDPDRWTEIYQLNRDRIADPDAIDVGWILRLPSAPASQGRAAAPVPAPHVPRGLPAAPASPGRLAPTPSPAPTAAASSAPAQAAVPAAPAAVPESGTTPAGTPTAVPPAADGRSEALRTALAGMSLFLAGAISGALLAGRRSQLFARPVGRRVPVLEDEAAALRAALAGAGDEETGGPDPDDLPMATVVLGDDDDGPVVLDLAETDGWLGVTGDPADVEAMVAGIALSLTCTRWSQGLEVVAAGPGLAWLGETGCEDVRLVSGRDAMDSIDALLAGPRAVPEDLPPVERVIVTDAVPDRLPDPLQLRRAGVVLVSPAAATDPPNRALALVRIESAESARLGSRVFAPQLVTAPVRRGIVTLVEATSADRTEEAPWWEHDGEDPRAADRDLTGPAGSSAEDRVVHVVDHPARAPVEGLGMAAMPCEHPHVPPPDEETDVSPSTVAEAPVLRVLGTVELVGARGERPSKAVRQCLEYCAWILAHPGSGSAQMGAALMVSEPTRRSNTSRLRRWLGRDDAGKAYLPDAYDGEIRMSDAVGTDWEKAQVMLVGGIRRTSDPSLRAVLDLVRGAPMADAAPGQWHWAEEWRTEMVQTIRDVGVELARRSRASGDLRTARFALDRALVCCPEDEELMCEKIRVAHLADDSSEVERLVYVLTRLARRLGVDLAEETVVLLQEVMEGQARARVV
ncbi:LysM peptidoglycan-binding domain-containing protein [Acidipropionibacterium virtanenii]|uniref:LysM domain-containing protein n=1 Tax=Acidipropionibacterium virtanenii TaxID=2057246 RepID=A0A344UPT7_9ACTN|nr:LysM peptidoglycan-binding domain-containing protein [Acidipropionibacterium virtanenii]AXE37285.1 hypothetical protein JS278_00088 [Acidipropionibacterium virtanenii]